MKQVDEKKQNRIIISNSAYSIGIRGLSYLLSFLTTPLLISCLGNTKYGIYTTALSLISWIYYFDFGIGSGLRNRITEEVVKGNDDAAQKSVNVSFIIISIVSVIAFLLALISTLFVNYDIVLNAQLQDENLNLILIIAIFLACVNFVLSLSKSILLAVQKTALVNAFGILAKILLVVSVWLYSQSGNKALLIVVIIEGLSELIKNGIALIYVKKKYPSISPSFEKPNFNYSKGILGFGLQIFIMQISALILNATDNLLIMRLYEAAEVTPYSLCHKYFSVINVFFVAATGPFWSTYTTAYTMGDVRYIKKTLKRALRIYVVAFVGIVIAYFVFRPFMRIYLQEELEYQTGLIMLVGLYYAILILSHNFSCFVHAISKVKYTTIACVIGAIANIPCSIFFATTCGLKINGIMLGSIVSLLITTPVYIYTTIIEIRKLETNKDNDIAVDQVDPEERKGVD